MRQTKRETKGIKLADTRGIKKDGEKRKTDEAFS